jgi:hypothetical protein
VVDAKESGKFKIDASELRAKYAALETEIRLLRELRAQVTSELRKQVQLQVRQLRRSSANSLRARR